ncbi:unnamed protein product [Cunninghamella blakesleeana]
MEEPRISKVIPTITCSSCLKPIPIKELVNHICYSDESFLKLAKPTSPLTLDTTNINISHKPSTSSPLSKRPPPHQQKLSSSSLQRNKSSSSETWKIAKTHHSSNVSKSITIESPLSSASPITPSDHPQQKPFLAFRTITTNPYPSIEHEMIEKEEEKMISFYKSTTADHSFPKNHIHQPLQPNSKLLSHYHHYFLKQQQEKKGNHKSCFDCKRIILDISFSIQIDHQHHYHEHCLKCSICRTSLNNYNYKEYHGKIYCKQDYQEFIQFKPNCATCHQTIEPHQRPTKAFNKIYHSEHLTCTHCSKPIDELTTGIVKHKKKLYCRKDFNQLYLPKCQGCHKAIEKEIVSSSDGKLKGKWHKHCFHCYTCKHPFPNNTFYIFQNQPYCKQHYHQLNHSLCQSCHLPIEGKCAQTTTMDGMIHAKYHPQCFTCYTCHDQITNIYFTDQHHHIYCSSHGQQKKKRETIFCDL